MVDKIKLSKELNEFIKGVEDFSREDLKKFIDNLPDSIFSENHLIRIQLPKDDKRSFKEFLISNGFGSEISLNRCIVEEGEDYIVFNPALNIICEFIISDSIKRRYNKDLGSIQLKDGVKLIELGSTVTSLYDIRFKCLADYIELEKESKTKSSATYEVYTDLKECEDREKFMKYLDISPSENLKSIAYTGLMGSIVTEMTLVPGKFKVSVPFSFAGTCVISASDSLLKSIENDVKSFLESSIKNSKIHIKKLEIELLKS